MSNIIQEMYFLCFIPGNCSCLSLAHITNDSSHSCICCACSCTVHKETCFTLNISQLLSPPLHPRAEYPRNPVRFLLPLGRPTGRPRWGTSGVMPQFLPMILRAPAFVATAPALSHLVCMSQSVLLPV